MNAKSRQHRDGNRSDRLSATTGRTGAGDSGGDLGTGRLSLGLKVGLSLALLFHLLAVFIAPFTFATRTGTEASPVAVGTMRVMQPYVDIMYLNHGYFFFAPEPGPSHLMRFKVANAKSGAAETVLTFPDLQQQWPRLRYHRHFMLSEWLHGRGSEYQQQLTMAQAERARGREVPMPENSLYSRLRSAYINRIRQQLKLAANTNVELVRVEHLIPGPFDYMREEAGLTDPRLYIELPEPSADPPVVLPNHSPPATNPLRANPLNAAPKNANSQHANPLNRQPGADPVQPLPPVGNQQFPAASKPPLQLVPPQNYADQPIVLSTDREELAP